MSVFESLKPNSDMKYNDLFHNEKPVFGMLHLSTPQGMTLLELARQETKIYLRHGIHPLIENYFGSHEDCETVLELAPLSAVGSRRNTMPRESSMTNTLQPS